MSAFWGVSPKCVLEILVFDLPFEAKNLSCIGIESQAVYISLHCILWLFTPRWWTLLSSSFTPANAECFAIGEWSKDVYNHFVYCKISDLTGIHISGIFETEQSHLKITVCLNTNTEKVGTEHCSSNVLSYRKICIIFVAHEEMKSYYFAVFGFFSHHTSRYGETLVWSIHPISTDLLVKGLAE